MKLICFYIFFTLLCFTLKAQQRNYFPFNAGFVPENFYNYNNYEQYAIRFDSIILKEKYNYFNSFHTKEYLDVYSFSNYNNISFNNFESFNYIVQKNKLYTTSRSYLDSLNYVLTTDTMIKINNNYKGWCKNGSLDNLIVSLNDSSIYLFKYNNKVFGVGNNECFSDGYFYFEIQNNQIKKSKFCAFKKQYNQLFYQPHANFYNKKWLIARDSFGYDIYLLENDTANFKNRVLHEEYNYCIVADFNSSSGWVSLSIKYDKIKNWSYRHSTLFGNGLKSLDSMLQYTFYTFNALTGQIDKTQTNFNTPLFYKSIYDNNFKDFLYLYTLPVDLEFSANDSFLYSLNGYGIRADAEYCSILNKNTPTELLQIKWHNNFIIKKLLLDDEQAPVYNNIELADDGRIYLAKSINFIDSKINNPLFDCIKNPSKQSALSVITKPNVWGYGCNYINDALPGIKVKSFPIDAYRLPEHYGRFYELNFTKKVNCNKRAIFQVKDTNWKYFDWFIFKDSIRTEGILNYQFIKSGIYKVKVKGYHKSGYTQWFNDTVIVRNKPNAYFSNQTIKGCQYIAFGFKDSSTVFQIKKDSAVRHAWHFGDGNSNYWQTYGLNIRKNQSHTYFQNGKYTVTHTVSDGYCTDSFSRINEVNILPAPKPGIDASPMSGCVPFSVRLKAKYPDTVDSSYWQSTAGHTQSTKNQIGTSFTFTQAGSFKIFHTQYGPTGCITKDTASIIAFQGINKLSSPQLIAASVLNNNAIVVHWQKTPFANAYSLYKDNALIAANIADTFYIDPTNANTKSYIYTLKATDVCNNTTQYSNVGKTILLKANKDKDDIGILRWSPYTNWANGVKQYHILNIENNNINILQQSTDSTYKDQDFLANGKIEKCYRIEAIENNGNNAQSQSNTVCVPYESVIWIPTAISINGDGLNESLKINTFGIQSYTIGIYNRWGQKVFESSSIGEQWQPTPQQQGVYMYVIKAKTNYGDYITKGTITVLR